MVFCYSSLLYATKHTAQYVPCTWLGSEQTAEYKGKSKREQR